jgi:hypothetical protein
MPWIFGNEGSGCMMWSARDLKFGGVIGGSGMKGNWTPEATRRRRVHCLGWYLDGVHKWKGPSSLGLLVQPASNRQPIHDYG